MRPNKCPGPGKSNTAITPLPIPANSRTHPLAAATIINLTFRYQLPSYLAIDELPHHALPSINSLRAPRYSFLLVTCNTVASLDVLDLDICLLYHNPGRGTLLQPRGSCAVDHLFWRARACCPSGCPSCFVQPPPPRAVLRGASARCLASPTSRGVETSSPPS